MDKLQILWETTGIAAMTAVGARAGIRLSHGIHDRAAARLALGLAAGAALV